MKNFLAITLLPLTLLLSFNAFGQEIDPSLLKNLSAAQIEAAKSQLSKSMDTITLHPLLQRSLQLETCHFRMNIEYL